MLRVKSTRVYSLLRESKQKIVGKYFIVVYMYDETITESAAGITVSKKVGNAVVRNKVKRRIKAFLNDYEVQGSRFEVRGSEIAPTNFYCNIIALSTSVGVEWMLFKGELEKSLRQLTVVS